jgi:hypothetical protein
MHCHEGQPELIEIMVEPHGGIRGHCSQCQRPAAGYDRLAERRWQFVPLWGIPRMAKIFDRFETARLAVVCWPSVE